MEDPKSAEPQSLLVLVTSIFQGFCAAQGLTLLSAAIDKHGSWEWSAGRSDALNRSLSLYLTRLGADQPPNPVTFLAETWVEAEDAHRFARRHIEQWMLEPEHGAEFSPKLIGSQLVSRLDLAWHVAERMSRSDLTEEFVVPRGSARSRR